MALEVLKTVVASCNFEALRAVLEFAEGNYGNLSIIKGDCQFSAVLTESESSYIRRMIKKYLVAWECYIISVVDEMLKWKSGTLV